MTINDAIIRRPLTGMCEIDVEKAVESFNHKCSITRWHDEYRLIRQSHKRVTALKVTISSRDALKIIKKLSLVEERSNLFNNAYTYRLKED